jgi:hypothetical protein
MALLSASVMFSSISKDAGAAGLHCNGRSQPKDALMKRYELLLVRLSHVGEPPLSGAHRQHEISIAYINVLSIFRQKSREFRPAQATRFAWSTGPALMFKRPRPRGRT